MSHTFKVLFVAINAHDGSRTAVIEIQSDNKQNNMHLFLHSKDLQNHRRVANKLTLAGIDVPVPKEAMERFVENRIYRQLVCAPQRLIVEATGWHSPQVFVTPQRTYGDAAAPPIHIAQLLDLTPKQSSSSLADWKSGIEGVTRYSHSAVMAISHALSGPLMSRTMLCRDGSVLNLWSADGPTGKSTLVQLAGTCLGSRVAHHGILSSNSTHRTAEETLNSCNQLLLPIDDLDICKNPSIVIERLLFGFSRSRHVDRSAMPLDAMSTPILSSARRPIGGGLTGSNLLMPRVINWPVQSTRKGGIFEHDAAALAESMRSLILRDAVIVCLQNAGAAGHAWLQHLTDIKLQGDYFSAAKKRKSQFMDERAQGLNSKSRRILERFSNIYGAACLAAELHIVPWNLAEGEASIQWCYERYMSHQVAEFAFAKPRRQI